MIAPQPPRPQPSVVDARAYSAVALALTGLVLWALQRWVFKNTVPPDVTSYVYILVPAAIGWVAAHLTRKHTT